MSRGDVAVPTGASAGDWYLLAVRCEEDATDITVDDDAFVPLTGTVGVFNNWQRIWQRPYNGDEPDMWHVDGVEHYAQAVVLVVTDVDPGGFVLGAAENTTGTNETAPTHTISAVTTTVDESLLLIGYISYWNFQAGTDVELTPPDPVLLISADETTPLRVWTLEVATAGTVGPWVADRSEETGANTFGVLSWTVVAPPASGGPLPSVVNHAVSVGFTYSAAPPPPRYLVGPNGEQVMIMGGTLSEQDALVAAQLAVWAAASPRTDFLTHYDADYAAADTATKRLMAVVRGLIPS